MSKCIPTKHTPGPWKVMWSGRTASGSVDSRFYHVSATAPAIPGFVGPRSVEIAQISPRIDPETDAANAALISAAPELLHELRELAELAHNVMDVPDSVWAAIDKAVHS